MLEPMPAARWQHVQQVLADAIECPARQRVALIDARCAGNSWLRREVHSLLIAHDTEGMVDRLGLLVTPPSVWGLEEVTKWSGRIVTHYRLEEPIGWGGMSVVYAARDERLDRRVALKFLLPGLSADARARSRFMAEAQAAAAVDHPNVCTIYESGEHEDGQLFIAMPLYDGETLQARVDRHRLTFDEALRIALQIAAGLGHVHDCGIVHRDVKPANIAILPDGAVRILDFGIAQVATAARFDRKPPAGTVSYMSPEQTSARHVDRRSDIWSLAIVIHEMLTGTRPFQRHDDRSVRDAILESEPRLTAASFADLPAGIDEVLRTALAKSPNQRYASMKLFAAELCALAPGRPTATSLVKAADDFGKNPRPVHRREKPHHRGLRLTRSA